LSTLTSRKAAKLVLKAKLSFDAIQDERAYRGKNQQSLTALYRVCVAAFASGKNLIRCMEHFVEDIDKGVARCLGLKTNKVSDTTFYELFVNTHPEGFLSILWKQIRDGVDKKRIRNDVFPGGVVAYDGKGCGSKIGSAPNDSCRTNVCDNKGTKFWNLFALRACLVSSSARPCIDQKVIPDKKGEATTFPLMFERDVKRFPKLFQYVTGDAGLASSSNAQLVTSKNKDYVFQIKGNFSVVYPKAFSLLEAEQVAASTTERYQAKTVRREIRHVAVPKEVNFSGSTQLLGVRQIRTSDDGQIITEDRVYITSIKLEQLTAKQLLKLIRLHWIIENGSNWTLDVVMKEDIRRPCNKGNGPTNIIWFNIIAYNLISMFRACLPKNGRFYQSWKRIIELVYQVFVCQKYERKYLQQSFV